MRFGLFLKGLCPFRTPQKRWENYLKDTQASLVALSKMDAVNGGNWVTETPLKA
jgi:hypothetical protein